MEQPRGPRGQEMTDDQRYAAIAARDARFDGMFFTCVRTTGIFCRPSCPARTPGRRSVEFAPSAAAAVAAGYRACKRCGPLAPPGSEGADPSATLARRALELIGQGLLDAGAGERGRVDELAAALHVSSRTLHRALVAHTGAGAVAQARMLRARRAHELLRGTSLPLSRIAEAAGFGSERQMHDVIRRVYGTAPSDLRRRLRTRGSEQVPGSGDGDVDGACLAVELAVRHPFDGEGLARWFAARAVPGVEEVRGLAAAEGERADAPRDAPVGREPLLWTRSVQLPQGPAVLQARLDIAAGPLPLEIRLADLRDYPAAIALARHLLDLDADPVGIADGLRRAVPALSSLIDARPGMRIPGTASTAEALLWAVTGQQVTVQQTLAQITRATDLLAQELPASLQQGSVHRAPVPPALAAEQAGRWFRGPSARRRALEESVPALADEEHDPTRLRTRLLGLRGVGPWTAAYTMLRGRRAIDSPPPRDAALLQAARDLGVAADHAALSALLERASPWGSYAAMHLWHLASAPSGPAVARSDGPAATARPAKESRS